MLVSVHAAASSPRTWGPILVHRSANLYSSNIFSRAQFCRHFLWVKLSCLPSGELDGVPKHILPTATYTYPVIALTTLYWDYGFNWESFSLQASHITFITAWPFQQRKSLHAPKPLPLLTHQVLPGPQHPTSFLLHVLNYSIMHTSGGGTWGSKTLDRCTEAAYFIDHLCSPWVLTDSPLSLIRCDFCCFGNRDLS